MWNKNNSCVIYRNSYQDTFNLNTYKKEISIYIDKINETDTWIRSGKFINDRFKDQISSYQLIGKAALIEGNPNIDILLLKTQVGISLDNAERTATDFIYDYLFDSSTDSAFVALIPSSGDGYISYFFGSPSFFKVKIPFDILSFVCIETIKNYLHLTHSIDISSLPNSDFHSPNTDIAKKAEIVDSALKNMKFCDMASSSGEIIFAMCSTVAEIRYSMNKFIDNTNNGRTKDDFINYFLSKSLHATDYHAGALATLKIGLLLTYPNVEFNMNNFIWGNILTENLFPSVCFDVIVTNPPHMRQELFSVIKDNLSSYNSYNANSDLYCYYTERAFSLLNNKGTLSLIMSNRWMQADYGIPLRKFLASKNISSIVDYDQIRPLKEISTPISIIFANNNLPSETLDITIVNDSDCKDIKQYVEDNSQTLNKMFLSNDKWNFVSNNITLLINKLNNSNVTRFSTYTNESFYRGILTGLNEAFIVDNKTASALIESHPSAAKILRPILSGRDVKRYMKPETKKQVIFMPRGYTDKMRRETDPYEWLVNTYPSVASHLAKYETKAMKRRDKGDYWWELRSCKYYNLFNNTKIICPSIVKKLSATLDDKKCISNDKTIIIASDDYYLLGLLNSSLMDFYFRNTSNKLLNNHFELRLALLASFPIRNISKTNSFSIKSQKGIETYAKRLSKLHSIPYNERTDSIADEIQSTERSLNHIVYKLYNLTPSEIFLVENN